VSDSKTAISFFKTAGFNRSPTPPKSASRHILPVLAETTKTSGCQGSKKKVLGAQLPGPAESNQPLARDARRRSSLSDPCFASLSAAATAEQVRHNGDVRVARVIQARQPEPSLERFQQREAVVERAALHARPTVVRLDS